MTFSSRRRFIQPTDCFCADQTDLCCPCSSSHPQRPLRPTTDADEIAGAAACLASRDFNERDCRWSTKHWRRSTARMGCGHGCHHSPATGSPVPPLRIQSRRFLSANCSRPGWRRSSTLLIHSGAPHVQLWTVTSAKGAPIVKSASVMIASAEDFRRNAPRPPRGDPRL